MRRIAITALCLAFTQPCSAEDEVRIQIYHIGVSAPVEDYRIDAGQSHAIQLASVAERVNIWPQGSFDVGRITLSGGPGSTPLQVVFGGGSAGFGAAPSTIGRDWAGLDAFDVETSVLWGGIDGDLTGSIIVGQLMRFDTEGAIDARLEATEDYPGLFIVRAEGGVTSDGSIVSSEGDIALLDINGDVEGHIQAGGNIGRVLISNGDLLDFISASNGKIDEVTVGGSIGTAVAPIDITAKSGLTSLEADSIHADLVLNSGGGLGGIQRIVATGATSNGGFTGSVTANNIFEGSPGSYGGPGVPEIDIAGDLDASFTVDLGIVVPVTVGGSVNGDWTLGGNLADFISVGGDLDADIGADRIGSGATFRMSIAGDVTAGASITASSDLTASTTLAIGGSLLGPISLGSGGLNGQVIVNSLNSAGSWSGDVTVGNTTLSPESAYTQTGLGGGAVGLAAFSLHKQDCDPPYSGATSPTTTSSNIQIELVHYGPIRHDGTGKPFKVEKYEGTCGPGPCNEPDPNDTHNWTLESIDGRKMTISGPLVADHHDHITPVRTGTDMLKCDGLDAAGDVPVAAYTYLIYREP